MCPFLCSYCFQPFVRHKSISFKFLDYQAHVRQRSSPYYPTYLCMCTTALQGQGSFPGKIQFGHLTNSCHHPFTFTFLNMCASVCVCFSTWITLSKWCVYYFASWMSFFVSCMHNINVHLYIQKWEWEAHVDQSQRYLPYTIYSISPYTIWLYIRIPYNRCTSKHTLCFCLQDSFRVDGYALEIWEWLCTSGFVRHLGHRQSAWWSKKFDL